MNMCTQILLVYPNITQILKYYGHKAQQMIQMSVTLVIHADSLALFALNIEIFLANVTKPEKSNILTLTWPVTSLVTPRSLKFAFVQ